MKVAAIQFKPTKGRKAEALERLTGLAAKVATDADLIVLPEMAATGYVFQDVQQAQKVSEAPDGPTFQALRRVAAQGRAWVVAGFPECATDGRLYNSAMVIDASGELQFTYRKTLLYDDDKTWATPGNSGYRAFETPRGAFTVGICMDLNDDRFVSWCQAAEVRAVAFPTNWIDQGHRVWGYWAWRMQHTGAALIAANTYGPEAHTGFSGESAIIDGRDLLAAAPPVGDGVIHADLSQPRSEDQEG